MNEHTKREKNSSSTESCFLVMHRIAYKELLLLASSLLVALLIFRWSALPYLSTRYLGGFSGDGGLYVWLLQHGYRDLFTLPWFDTHAFYPYSKSLAWSDNFILPSLLALPLTQIGIPLPLVYNSILLLSMWLGGFLTALLCSRLIGNFHAALIGGLTFLCSSSLSSALGHPQLQFSFWIPLATVLFFEFIATPKFRLSLGIGLSMVGAFLCAVHFSLFIFITIFSFSIALLFLRPAWFSVRKGTLFLGGILIGSLPLLFCALPYLKASETFGARGLYEGFYFSANLLSYFSSSQFSLLYGITAPLAHDEAHLFNGLVVIFLAGVALQRVCEAPLVALFARCSIGAAVLGALCAHVRSSPLAGVVAGVLLWTALGLCLYGLHTLAAAEQSKKITFLTTRSLIGMFLMCALLFFGLSLGPLGNPEKGQWALGFFSIAHTLIPGFDSIRAVSRFGIGFTFILSVLAAFGAFLLMTKHKWRPPLVVGCVALLALENLHTFTPVEGATPPPPILETVRQNSSPHDALIILPFSGTLKKNGTVDSWREFARLHVTAMNWAIPFERPLVNGYSGQQSKLMRELPLQLINFPDTRSIKALKEIIGLRYVVFVPSLVAGFDLNLFSKRAAESSSVLRLVEIDREGNYLFELSGETALDSSFQFEAPAVPDAEVSLQLRTEPASKDLSLTVYSVGDGEHTNITTFELPQSGEQRTFSFKLPSTDEKVRPFRFLLKNESNSTVFLGKTSFITEDRK